MGTSASGHRLYWKLAIGVVAAAGAYGWYVSARHGRLNDVNQRQLANAATELKHSIENAVETIRRFKPPVGDSQALCRFDEDQPHLALVSHSDCDDYTGVLTDVALTATSPIEITARASASKGEPRLIKFRFLTEAVLAGLSFPESFRLIVIAKDDGSVLYQESPSKRPWLRQLRWGEQHFRDAGADRQSGLRVEHLATAFGDDPASGWKRLRSMSGRSSLGLGGQPHEIYLEPLVVANQGNAVLLLGGAVPAHALWRQAFAVDSYFLAAIVFMLLVAALGFPVVKLMALDAHERFRLRDIMALYLSTAALAALCTFTAQAFDAYVRWHDVADDGLKQVAANLERAYLEELSAIRRQMDDYDQVVSQWPQGRFGQVFKNWYKSPRPPLLVPDKSLLIYQVSWINPDGSQVFKISADAAAALQPVAQRVYFRSVRDGHLLECARTPDRPQPSKCASATGPFYAGPDWSVTDGKFYTFMAVPSRKKAPDGRGYVVSVTARLFSLSSQPLPAGYGFALINREGRVLYHSDRRLALREYLFDELSQGASARAMVYAGTEGDLTTAYRERPHEFHFRPVSLRLAVDADQNAMSAGLYVVTFRDISIERALVARVFVISLLGPMLLLLTIVAVSQVAIAMVPLGRRQHWGTWLWPQGALTRVYRAISVVLSGFVAISLILWAVDVSGAVFLAVPILALVSAIGVYALLTRRTPAHQPLHSMGWHSAMFLLLLICTIVIPASVLFRAAMGHEFGKLIETERAWMRATRTDLEMAFEAGGREENRPPSMRSAMARTLGASFVSPPPPFDAVPSAMGPAHVLLGPFDWVDDLVPVQNDSLARERYKECDCTYTPRGSGVSRFGISGFGAVSLVAITAGLLMWIRWKDRRLFFAEIDMGPPAGGTPAELWAACTAEEHLVLVRVASDRVANPHQRTLVESLLKRGLLSFDPDLRPYSPAFTAYILEQKRGLGPELAKWEAVESGHSWRYVRLVLLSVGCLGIVLVAAQPGLQSGLLGVAGGITAAMTTLLKLRDAVSSWMATRSHAP